MTESDSNQPGSRHSRHPAWPWVAKAAVSGFFLWYVLRDVPLAHAFEEALAQPALNLAAAFALVTVQAILAALRWTYVVSATGGYLPPSRAIPITFVSLFFNQFLPASVGGDIVRVWQSSRAGLTLANALSTVMLERFGNLLCVLALTVALLPLWSRHAGSTAAQHAFLLTGAAALAALIALMFLDRLPGRWSAWRVVRAAGVLARDARALFLRPLPAFQLGATAIAGQATLAAAVLALASGLGLKVSYVDCLVLMPPVVLLTSLPISVAGWGVREFAIVAAFGMLGVSAESALALSVLLALVGTTTSLPGGLIWLSVRRARGADAERDGAITQATRDETRGAR